ncbi:MAG TPA: CHAT domain-containing protein [Chitinophagales bacterium]|nr:CHAT domain-containing protein [Chitinophagales bacterium]HRK28517.1 CHAT domain-containing protein [Chitinophagales bacterium]
MSNLNNISANAVTQKLQEAIDLHKKGLYRQSLDILTKITSKLENLQAWEQYVLALNTVTACFLEKGNFELAVKNAANAVQYAINHLETTHQYKANAYFLKGLCLLKQQNHEQALTHLEQSLTICRQIWGINHAEVAKVLSAIGAVFTEKGNFQLANQYLHDACHMLQATQNETSIEMADCHQDLVIYHWYKGNLLSTLHHCRMCLDIRLHLLGNHHPQVANAYNNLGNAYVYLADFDSAIENLQKGLTIQLNMLGDLHPNTANCYHNLGNAYYQKSDFDRAINYTEKALRIRLQILGELHRNTAISYHNIGAIYWGKNDFQNSLSNYQKSLQIRLNLFGELHMDTAVSYHNIGALYDTNGMPEQALHYCQKALNIRLKTLGAEHPDIASSYNNMATNFIALHQYTDALHYCMKGLQLWQQTLGNNHFNLARGYHNLATIYLKMGNHTTAAQQYQHSITYLIENYAPQSVAQLPNLTKYKLPIRIIGTLKSLAQTLLEQYTQQPKNTQSLLLAWYYSHAASLLTDQMRQSYSANGSRLSLATTAKEIHQQATKICLQIIAAASSTNLSTEYNHLSKLNPNQQLPPPHYAAQIAFQYAEKSKAMVLLSNLKDAQARFVAGIPMPLLEEEKELRLNLTYYEKRILQEQEKKVQDQNLPQIAEWKNGFFELKNKYDELVATFEKDYPDYYLLKYQTETVNISHLQKALPHKTCMVAFFLSDNYIYAYTITQLHFTVLQTPKPPDFDDDVKDFLHFGIGAFGTKQISKKEYLHLGHRLYQLLLQPVVNQLPTNDFANLIIIPDGILATLPFEALLTHQPADKNIPYSQLPYLVLNYSVSYHLSATLWHYQQQKAPRKQHQSNTSVKSYLGIAPVYNQTPPANTTNGQTQNEQASTAHYKTLPFSEDEIGKTRQLFTQSGLSADALLHHRATIANFSRLANAYHYIHFAAHGILNESKPELTGILFSPDETNPTEEQVLYLADVFNLRLNAQLVVLSCCDSGVGKEIKGEGALALNRGFLYAGAKNVVYTLYKVDDQYSSQLVGHLFECILQRLPYHKALRQAKLNMIAQNNLPVYWSGYVLMGTP